MSLLTLVIRFSDKSVSSFKVHKKEDFANFLNISFIHNEEDLKKYMSLEHYPLNVTASNIEEHKNYDSFNAFIAPFDYGIILIDFFNKQIYNYNDYSGFYDHYVWSIKPLIGKIFSFNKFNIDFNEPNLSLLKDEDYDNLEIKAPNYRNKNVNIINPFKQNSITYNSVYNLYQAIKNKDSIYFYYMSDYNNRDYFVYDSSSINNTLNNIINRGEDFIIGIEPLGWKAHQGNRDHIKEMYSYVENNFSLSDDEINVWKEYTK